MKTRVFDRQINAFVDGELSPADAALVAEAIAADPVLAQRVLRLHRMKAALAAYGDDLPLPSTPEPVRAYRRPRRKLALCGAAAVAIFVLLGVVPTHTPEPRATHWPILAQHDLWLHGVTAAEAMLFPEGFAWMEAVISTSGLQLVHADIRPEATHLGFKGPNACRLSLFITPADKPEASLHLNLTESVQHAQWQVEGFAFEMIARDMAIARFATVATGLHQGSVAHGTVADLRIALLQSARLPCLV